MLREDPKTWVDPSFCLWGATGHLGGCSDGWWVSVAGRYLRLPVGYGGMLRMLCFSLSLLGWLAKAAREESRPGGAHLNALPTCLNPDYGYSLCARRRS